MHITLLPRHMCRDREILRESTHITMMERDVKVEEV